MSKKPKNDLSLSEVTAGLKQARLNIVRILLVSSVLAFPTFFTALSIFNQKIDEGDWKRMTVTGIPLAVCVLAVYGLFRWGNQVDRNLQAAQKALSAGRPRGPALKQ